MKIDGQTEKTFAQAVALSQNGRLKSTIHVGGNEVFILNMDNTILLRFPVKQKFDEPFSFFANDYESPRIRLKNGRIVFISRSSGYTRRKECAAPETTLKDVRKMWKGFKPSRDRSVGLSSDLCGLLDDGLSHVELSRDSEAFRIVQQDIYTGARIEVTPEQSTASFGLEDDDFLLKPIGMRTIDFKALFTYEKHLTFSFQSTNWAWVSTDSGLFSGIVSTCLYNELGYTVDSADKADNEE